MTYYGKKWGSYLLIQFLSIGGSHVLFLAQSFTPSLPSISKAPLLMKISGSVHLKISLYFFPLWVWFLWWYLVLYSVQLSRSVLSDSLRHHELQHTRPPCPSPTPRVHSNSCPLSQWCHPAISSSVIPFSSCPQSLPASESFPMSQHFARGGQSIGVAALAPVLPMNTQDWFPLESVLVGSPCSPRDSQESSPTPQFKSINSSALSFLHSPTLTSVHDYWKNHR